jgi:methylisocitrate lyase
VSADEFARFAEAVPAPLLANMTEFGRGPLLDFATLSGLGYRAVLYPLTDLRALARGSHATSVAVEEAIVDFSHRSLERRINLCDN